jgi:tetrahydrodipicolinate N-succinyltransferase
MNTVSIIGCVVGIIGCVIGVATFVSAQLTRARQDGVLVAKVDQCVKGIDEIKGDVKERNEKFDKVIDEHTRDIAELKSQMHTVMNALNL